MLILLWLSVFLFLVAAGLYVIRAFRDAEVSAKTVRMTFLGGLAVCLGLFFLAIPETQRTGKMVWQKYFCIDCHAVLGNGASYAADLTRAWNRFVDRAGGNQQSARVALVAFLRNPPQPTMSRRGMPRVISDADAESLADFLTWTSNIDTNGCPPRADAQRSAGSEGAKLFDEKGCAGCHSIGSGPIVGPDLAGIGTRYTRDQLIAWIHDPDGFYIRSKGKPANPGYPRMPALGVSEDDAGLIADFLLEQKEVAR